MFLFFQTNFECRWHFSALLSVGARSVFDRHSRLMSRQSVTDEHNSATLSVGENERKRGVHGVGVLAKRLDRSSQEFLVSSREPTQSFRGLRQRPKLATSFSLGVARFAFLAPRSLHPCPKAQFHRPTFPARICTLLAVIPQPPPRLVHFSPLTLSRESRITVQPPVTNPTRLSRETASHHSTGLRTLRVSPDICTFTGLSVEICGFSRNLSKC